MKELKPKLIMADSGRRRRRSPGSGLWSFLTFLIIFAVGVYVGTKLDDAGLWDGESSTTVQTEVAPSEGAGTDEVPSPAGSDDMRTGSVPESTRPFDPVIIVDAETVSDDAASVIEPQQELNSVDFGDSNEVGVTSLSPEKISGESPDAGTETILSPETAVPESDTAGKDDPVRGGEGRYTLQVAAFSTPEDARKAADDYRSKGYNAYVVRIENSKGEKWSLVKIGKFGSIEQAWGQLAQFKRREGKDAYVETLSQKTAVNESWSRPAGTD